MRRKRSFRHEREIFVLVSKQESKRRLFRSWKTGVDWFKLE